MAKDTLGACCLCRSNMAEEASDLLGELANTERLMVVALLHETGEMNVSEMVEALGASRASLSRQLGRLRDLGIVTTRRIHNRVYYRLSHPKAAKLITVLGTVLRPAAVPTSNAAE